MNTNSSTTFDSREARRPSSIDLRVESARRELAEALRAAEQRGVVAPTAFIAATDSFAGLAFARELRGAQTLVGRPRGSVIVGCESRNVVACALLAVGNTACNALLDLRHDTAEEIPLVILDAGCRVVTLSRAGLEGAAPAAQRWG